MEAYVDDMIVKSMSMAQHVTNLQETFAALQRYNMWLNLTKGAFEVLTDKFLDFIISQKRIEANLEKIRAILELFPPQTTIEV